MKRVVLDKDKNITVYQNPSNKDLKLLLKKYGQLRGAASPGAPLIVWSASDWVHHTIEKYYGYEGMQYYLYYSLTRNISSSEWNSYMCSFGEFYIGVKFTELDKENNEIDKSELVLAHKMVARTFKPF